MSRHEANPAPAGFLVRDMLLSDIDEVWELEKALFPADAWPREMFVGELELADTRSYWVVLKDGKTVGYCGLMCVLPLADVQTIAVNPAQEGHGIGTHLLRLMINAAQESNATDLLLEVREDNPRARGCMNAMDSNPSTAVPGTTATVWMRSSCARRSPLLSRRVCRGRCGGPD
ncbi:GNAT family N-acetyltransferase [Paeniglutamicibacter gangotriensis]|uniref:Ribosomal protein S18 alanine N-acetyltransferase n=1 Tax=Paeniglutamicibacter gangotriensis Lz1y TaxID=1276920 RepID=M7MSZ7_9MICC|nr:GNAT family N-acetyltransferase [Paeniglutamicibacter gangotriensis]EMQ99542.1 ribosomal protein S18 alanine N-acetyltransferase [Paeniglutamicibacter gangotriensis Lz1y]